MKRVHVVLLLMWSCAYTAAAKECGECESVKKNLIGEDKCVRDGNCCKDGEEKVNCFVDPCVNFKSDCPNASQCVAVYCSNTPCQAIFYDPKLNAISGKECTSSRTKRNALKEKQHAQKLNLEIPVYQVPAKSERPENCPSNQLSEIIKACTDECQADRDCPSRRKCCWNGCARRCTKPLIKDPTNYLNLPLLTNDD